LRFVFSEYRERCYLFRELPSKKQYPDYYMMIHKPIAMDIIKRRINSPYYKIVGAFRDDWHLMFNNARLYNVEGSMVYTDANEMQVSSTALFYLTLICHSC